MLGYKCFALNGCEHLSVIEPGIVDPTEHNS